MVHNITIIQMGANNAFEFMDVLQESAQKKKSKRRRRVLDISSDQLGIVVHVPHAVRSHTVRELPLDDEGKFLLAKFLVQDVADRAQLRRALHKRNAAPRQLFEAHPIHARQLILCKAGSPQ